MSTDQQAKATITGGFVIKEPLLTFGYGKIRGLF